MRQVSPRVAAPAEAGKANRAVIELLEAWPGVKGVTIVAGASSAKKTVRVETHRGSAAAK